jgi:hypothetical protein
MTEHTHNPANEPDARKSAQLTSEPGQQYAAVRYRAAGSSPVWFGPFPSLDAVKRFIDDTGVGMAIIELVDPKSDPDTWWF